MIGQRLVWNCWTAAAVAAVLLMSATQAGSRAERDGRAVTLPPWSQGQLDIYHINTGRGDAAFFIFPDGTTMLFDAGDLDGEGFEKRAAPLRLAPRRPSASITPGEAIAAVIKRVVPEGVEARIDYAVISHFDGDHYGEVRAGLRASQDGTYELTGISEVAEHVPIATLIDRAYPGYDEPTDLRTYHGRSLTNYLAFQDAARRMNGMAVERLDAGSARQIALKKDASRYPAFEVRNVKANERLWTGQGEETRDLFSIEEILDEKERFQENPLSLALRVSYGLFDYFTGGDNTGERGAGIPAWFDVETPIAQVVGEVDVLALNHHGHRDATNECILRGLRPRILVQQSWVSDQPGQEVVHRMASPHIWSGARDVLSTNFAEETRVAIGPIVERTYASFEGHVLVRVSEGGANYQVFVLDDTNFDLGVKLTLGPIPSR